MQTALFERWCRNVRHPSLMFSTIIILLLQISLQSVSRSKHMTSKVEKYMWARKWQFFDKQCKFATEFWHTARNLQEKRLWVLKILVLQINACKTGIFRPEFCTFRRKFFKQKKMTEPNPNCNTKQTRTEPNFNSNRTKQNLNLNLSVRFASLN